MSVRTTTISADGTYEVAQLKRNPFEYFATVSTFGTFGGGTITLQMSPDNGTTKITQETSPGTSYSATANSTVNFRSGMSRTNTPVKLYITLAGSVSPSLTVIVDDNV